MKVNKILFPLAAVSMVFASCDDQVMEWKEPDRTVTGSEIPMELAEKISQYDYIKNYMAQYHPNVDITLGMGLDDFLDEENPAYAQTVLDNFQGVTFGNAMKHQSIVSSSGAFNWDKVDRFIAMNTGLKLHGHNLIWHTQQQQTYMKSLIAPELVVESDPTNDIANVLSEDNSTFENGNKGGWGSWGNSSTSGVESPGHDSQYCMVLDNPSDASSWSAQCAYTFDTFLEPGVYKIRFYAKSSSAAGKLQFQYQNSETYGSQDGYNTFDVGTNWVLCEHEFELTFDDVNRIILNFGEVGAKYYIDDIEFGLKQDVPSSLCPNGNFANGLDGWSANNPGAGVEVLEIGDAPSGNKNVLKMTASSSSANAWDLQVTSSDIPAQHGKQVELSFFVKSEGAGQGRVSFNGLTNGYPWMNWTGSQSSWTEAFETSTSWTQIKVILQKFSTDFADGEQTWKLNLDFGYVADMTYYIDNVMVTVVEDEPAAASAASRGSRATSISYVPKTDAEKKAILLNAMEEWIKEAMTHVGNACTSWDVINEPIGDDCRFRGIDGGWMEGDSEPTESTEDGLNLNWSNETGNGHFYWGYYCGMDYAVKAFEYAAKYSPNGAKLFVNDYNLETNPSKLAKLIEFVEYIDNNGAHVDGIGTQMHVSKSITKEQVDAMFQTLATTGKLIRITELDVALGTASPSAEELQAQSDVYQMILTSYFENIPESQQSAITLWTLSDNSKEHEYWLKDESPNIFDSKYGRKIAYKGVCDAIAGKDIGAEFTSHDWSQSAK